METTKQPILAIQPIDFSFLRPTLSPQSKPLATQQQPPDLFGAVFKFAFKIGTTAALAAVEVESENHLREWKRHRDGNDVIALLALRVLHRGIERLDESLDN